MCVCVEGAVIKCAICSGIQLLSFHKHVHFILCLWAGNLNRAALTDGERKSQNRALQLNDRKGLCENQHFLLCHHGVQVSDKPCSTESQTGIFRRRLSLFLQSLRTQKHIETERNTHTHLHHFPSFVVKAGWSLFHSLNCSFVSLL